MYDPLAGRFDPVLSERNVFTPDDAQTILYGMDRTERVVAIEPHGSNEVLLYRRGPAGRTVTERRVMSPWLIASDLRAFQGNGEVDITELRGEHPYRYLVTLGSWDAFRAVTQDERLGRDSWIGPRTLTQQYQLRSGLTLFQGMQYSDLRRMQIDLETLSLDPASPDAGIIMISVRQGAFEEVLVRESTEEELLERFVALVKRLDPDVIEGHNLYRFDLPYLIHRATKVGVPLKIGRNGGLPRIADGARRQETVYLHGRHLIDTYQQIQRFDVSGSLSRYGLKSVVREMGLEREDRTFVAGASIADLWRQGQRERDTLAAYALDDVRDVDALSRVIMPTMFFQTQMLPTSYQRATLTGTGRKIDDFMFRTYLAAGHSIPRRTPGRAYAGGYSAVLQTGVFDRVVKCDVESLYPSIMIREAITSSKDVLQAFPVLLRDLTQRRLDAKRHAASADGQNRATWTALQASFKILINSFYGYLGFGGGAFNDYTAAERVTLEGQRLIREVVGHLEELGATPIEIDTDGVYFTPPDTVQHEPGEEAFIAAISDRLPAGINLAHDGRFAKMLSLKIKTYALLGYDDTVTLKGSALRSRAVEQCFQHFIRDAAEAFLRDEGETVRDRYFALAEALQHRAVPAAELSQWTMLRQDTIGSRPRLQRLLERSPGRWQYGERIEVYERNDGELALTEDYAGDENTVALLKRLHEVADRFRPLYRDDAELDAAFPRITPTTNVAIARTREPARQMSLL